MNAKESHLLNKAKALIAKADRDGAKRILSKIIHKRPTEAGLLLGILEYHNHNHKEAKKHLLAALAHDNLNTELLQTISTVELAAGKLNKALKFSSKALSKNKKNVTSINHHATILISAGNTSDAIACLKQSLAINHNQPSIKIALASLYERNNDVEKAIPIVQEIFEADPDDFEAGKHLASLYSSAGANRKAAYIYGKFLRNQTHQESALPLLLANLSSTGKHQRILRIISAIEKQRSIDDQFLVAKINALRNLGRHADAISYILSKSDSLQNYSGFLRIFDETVAQSRLDTASLIDLLIQFPKNGHAEFKLGKLAADSGNYHSALRHYINSLTFLPGLFDAHYEAFRILSKSGNKLEAWALMVNTERIFAESPKIDFLMAYAHYDIGNTDHAITYLKSCLAAEPEHCKANALLGDAYKLLNKPKLALQCYKKAFDADKSDDLLAGKLAHEMLMVCDWSNLDDIIKIAVDHTLNRGGCCHPFQAHSLSDDPEFHRVTSERFLDFVIPPQKPKHPPSERLPTRRNRIRIAYISSDFRVHPVAHHMLGILQNHSREKFEIYALSLKNENSPIQKQLAQASEHFLSIDFLSDTAVIDFLRSLDLDIAVDLNGYTGDSRANLFKNRIARIQINYLGFLGTMGCNFMDYIIADRTLIPDAHCKHYSENIIYLKSYQCNLPRPENLNLPKRSDYQLPSEGFIFASFNNTYKINPFVLSCWSEILKNTQNAYLWTYIKHAEAKENFLHEAKIRGIDSDQIIFADFAAYEEHLARHQLADLYLDTFPYNAGATAGNALKMGLPIITLAGNSFPSRYSASLLESLQLSELVCNTPDDYIRTAIELAKNKDRLSMIKKSLKENLKTSISFNPMSFTKNLEEAYTMAMDGYFNNTKGHIYT